MGSLYFRSRQYQSIMDASYFVRNGPEFVDFANYREGDEVSIIFPITKEQYEAIDSLDRRQNVFAVASGAEYTTHIKLRVVERSHSLARNKEFGTLVDLGHSVTLEAANGYWEDILRWILFDTKPAWADSDE